ncbi:MAG: hypothetical protein GWN82_24985 [Gemmatimonadetes bacterium]|nr:hypothetical protein [Actinomycetota bacterium]NIT90024.1 hypothetical protein [Gemmatimonadota bacterium]NIS34934.1 hypothetical protein [Actinomycetota bacterium]NIU33831.1 hypothetical protein [Gemmatimonadota bacterium]NIU69678.1 hypothetical protein [Actinomycetota bacterium]
MVCADCRPEGSVRLRPGITVYLSGLARSRFTELPEPDPSYSAEAMGVARRFVEYHLDRRLASLAVLEG